MAMKLMKMKTGFSTSGGFPVSSTGVFPVYSWDPTDCNKEFFKESASISSPPVVGEDYDFKYTWGIMEVANVTLWDSIGSGSGVLEFGWSAVSVPIPNGGGFTAEAGDIVTLSPGMWFGGGVSIRDPKPLYVLLSTMDEAPEGI